MLCAAFSQALAEHDVDIPADELKFHLQRSRHADYQSSAAMALGKRFGIAPRELATKAARHAENHDAIEVAEVAGPGFVNIHVARRSIASELTRMLGDSRLGVPHPEALTVVVDYSSPNLAKEMHVGHLRSTVIGDACVRMFEWLGHTVIRRNHIGDWGTPFGMLIEHLKDCGETSDSDEFSVTDLSSFYKAARGKFDANEEFRERSRARVVALQAGDVETIRLWKTLVQQSQRYFLEVYEKIDVRLEIDDFHGESAYNDKLHSILDELRTKQMLEISDSAECVFLEGFASREGDPLPLIVRKRDGGFGYAATDLAALHERAVELQARRLLYVVGAPQRQHFEMIFAAGKKLGWLCEETTAEHIAFGSVLGTDGKMLASRSGDAVKLVDLLDQAIIQAARIVAQKSPHLAAVEQSAIAHAVGIGAIKYADLSTDRTRDYVFDLDKMLSLEGNTAPYLQYAIARINSLLRESDITEDAHIDVAHEAERELALTLLEFPEVLKELSDSLLFHRLANYLFELATTFSRFYSKCPIHKAETEAIRDSRLRLASLSGNTLRTGLSLLGIRAPERM